MKTLQLLGLSLGLAALIACGTTEGGDTSCTPGATQSCACTDGASGAQTCVDDGSEFGACVCEGGADAGDAATDADDDIARPDASDATADPAVDTVEDTAEDAEADLDEDAATDAEADADDDADEDAAPDADEDAAVDTTDDTAGDAGDVALDTDDACGTNEDCGAGEYCASALGVCGAGVCMSRPVGCSREFAPVCGCDGETYSNDCVAAAAGASVSATGPCGCNSNEDCDETDYCAAELGVCGEGTCTARPEACPLVYDPVCGCDGETYGNGCVAASSGVSVAADGECESGCASDEDCGDGEYCASELGVCGGGECTTQPLACPDVYDPVCGCDGATYGNGCEAAAAGVSVSSRGECPTTGGCTTNRDCDRAEYCAVDPGVCGGEGACEERPGFCPRIYDPVCGCNGETYGNSCEAAAAGVNVSARGECAATGGCNTNGDCDRAEFCDYGGDVCVGTGECSLRPEFCPAIYDPVCGCDGRTYSNACNANSSGVSVAAAGTCEDET